jgi:ABC-type sugar transport system permease subunit
VEILSSLKKRSTLNFGSGVITPYLYIAPAVVLIALVFAYPVVSVVISSFQEPGLLGKEHFSLHNFGVVFGDQLFWVSVKNNFRLFLTVPVMTVLALLIAAFLYEEIRGWRFYRSVVFLPYVLPVPVIGVVFSYILQRNGVLNEVLAAIGLGQLQQDWLGNPNLAIWSIWVVIVWQQLGFGIILFLARLMGVDSSLYEAAMIDRANWWQRFRHITIPQLASVIEFFVIVSLLNMLSWVFGYVFVMTGGGPSNSTYVTELLIYNTSFREGLFNVASAISAIVLAFASVILLIRWLVQRNLEDSV